MQALGPVPSNLEDSDPDSHILLAARSPSLSSHWAQLQWVCSDGHYRVLFVAFSLGIGFFFTVLTLLNQLIQPLGYTNDDAGTFGSVFIVCGLVGAAVAGYAMERTKAYRMILKVGLVGCELSAFFLFAMLFKDNFAALLLAFALLGESPPLPPPFLPLAHGKSVSLLIGEGNIVRARACVQASVRCRCCR